MTTYDPRDLAFAKLLEAERFAAWLDGKPADEDAGRVGNATTCPVARYLSETGATFAHADSALVYGYWPPHRQSLAGVEGDDVPAYLSLFMDSVDGVPPPYRVTRDAQPDHVTAGTARKVLAHARAVTGYTPSQFSEYMHRSARLDDADECACGCGMYWNRRGG